MIEMNFINISAAAIGILIQKLKEGPDSEAGGISLTKEAIQRFHENFVLVYEEMSDAVDDSGLIGKENIDRVCFRVDSKKKGERIIHDLPTCSRCGSTDIDEGTSRCRKCGEPRAI